MVTEFVALGKEPCLVEAEGGSLYCRVVLERIQSGIENPAIQKLKDSKTLAQVYLHRRQILNGTARCKVGR